MGGAAGAADDAPLARDLPSYRVRGDHLEMGASLGNAKCWVNIRGNGDVESLFSVDVGLNVYGAIATRYAGAAYHSNGAEPATSLASQAPESRSANGPRADAALIPEDPGQVELHPAYQRRSFVLPGRLHVQETVFVPYTAGPERGATYDGAVVYQVVDLYNYAHLPQRLHVHGYARLRGQTPRDVLVTFDAHVRQGALLSRNASHPQWVRIFGVAGDGVRVAGHSSTCDASATYDLATIHALDNHTDTAGDVIGALQVDVDLAPGERKRFAFVAVFSPGGEGEARRLYAHAWDFEMALRDTVAYYAHMIGVADVLTPDPMINEGVVWAKVNMLRVMADYPQGRAFTNDPGRSSHVVGRDAAWFVSGCDYLLPEFSRALLDAFARRQHPSGKIVEYFNAVTGETDDYGLNINDNTPLFIVAIDHYYRTTGDLAYLRRIYPAVARAARYLLSQRDTELPDDLVPSRRGLVYCTARGEGLQGIAGWRNIMDGYAINGAVTEINAECVAALRAASYLTREVGQPPAEALALRRAADELAEAMNRHLLVPATGLYCLNIDVDDYCHTDVTADELFPVMFGVAPDDVAYRIVSRLCAPDFWTPAGIRTVSRRSLDYSPHQNWGLMGGVWPGVTWWLAIAAGRYYPHLMVRALRASFEHFCRDPRADNTVPGQFSEWFDGESLMNRGMRLSPWEPPRFLWAAIEGVCGIVPLPHKVRVRPLLPSEWKWLALRRLPYHGRSHAFFAARQAGGLRFYSTVELEVEPGNEVDRFEEDVTSSVHTLLRGIPYVALRRPGAVAVCVGSDRNQAIEVPLRLHGLLEPGRRYAVAVFTSERNGWEFDSASPQAAVYDMTVRVEAGGTCVLVFHAQ